MFVSGLLATLALGLVDKHPEPGSVRPAYPAAGPGRVFLDRSKAQQAKRSEP